MIIPKIKGIIDRRILINYKIDRHILEKVLPFPFKPKIINGKGIAGICLIRLKEIRPKGLPRQLGISSENGAHRIAVEWIDNGVLKEGVYVPRRDTSSKFNALVGGRVFPGIHHLAEFKVKEQAGAYEVGFISDDNTSLSIKAKETSIWNSESIFENLNCASKFFEDGSHGYSPGKNKLEGLKLKTFNWKVSLLDVLSVQSSFFENEDIFPKESVEFDNALLMKNIEHEWSELKSITSN